MQEQKRVVVIDDEAGGLPPGLFEKDKVAGAWPDGKLRPHKVKTRNGETVHLTDEEFDRLVLEARHRRHANPCGPRTAPDFNGSVGDQVVLSFPDAAVPMSGNIVKKKPGRLEVELNNVCVAKIRKRGIGATGRAFMSDPMQRSTFKVVSCGRQSVRLALVV